jgi:riboflavin synthase
MSTYQGDQLGWVSTVISAILGISKEVSATSKTAYDASVNAAHALITKEEQDAADALAAVAKAEQDKKNAEFAKTGLIITAVVVAAVVLGIKGAPK